MNPLIVFFASGTAFYAGLVLALIALVLGFASVRKWVLAARVVVVMIAMILILLSATPLPEGVYLCLLLVAFVWFAGELALVNRQQWLIGLRALVAAACVLVGALEGRYALMPAMPAGPFDRVYVIGDSISAGIGTAGVAPWPVLVRDAHGIEIVDLARSGATLESASRMLEDIALRDGLVILEIGGNDLLGRTSAAEFAADLERLLQQVTGPDRSVVMLELPLLPTQNGIGRAQRALARQYNVTLVPKRAFANIIGLDGGTLDGLHLSSAGHEAMAEMIWGLIQQSNVRQR